MIRYLEQTGHLDRFKVTMKQTYIQEKSVEVGLQFQLINQYFSKSEAILTPTDQK